MDGHLNVEVRALADASLNGRAWQPLIDSTVDLSREPLRLGSAPWIVALTEPLPGRGATNDRVVRLKPDTKESTR